MFSLSDFPPDAKISILRAAEIVQMQGHDLLFLLMGKCDLWITRAREYPHYPQPLDYSDSVDKKVLEAIANKGASRFPENIKEPPSEYSWMAGPEEYASLENILAMAGDITEILSKKSDGHSSGELPFLDPQHKHYSKELALAVKAWLALYDTDGGYRPEQAHKRQIESMLVDKGLSVSAIERISTLVNPQKKGGAPVSGS